MYRKILVPIDGSPTSARGLAEAVAMARACGASLVLLHVVDAYPLVADSASVAAWEAMLQSLRAQGKAILDQSASVASAHGVAAEETFVESPSGRVADRIVEAAERSGADLIVMGTHGRRGFSRLTLGSDAELVMRAASVPVLLVRYPATDDE